MTAGPDWPAFDNRLSGVDADDESGRSSTQRDRDRVLYSESFRRLGAVTQVAIGGPETLLHNRLTHSLKVEQVGLSLFRYLKSDGAVPADSDEWAIAAACLAHDLGHPPFGHAGEEELNALVTCDRHRETPRTSEDRKSKCLECKLEDGFEGNAQSFRVLTSLAETGRLYEDSTPWGLDLTVRTLRAASKYPWLRGDNTDKPEKWGAYDIDAPALAAITRQSQDLAFDAQVMDWADDIAYAVHDIEDFHRTGHIPLDQYFQWDIEEETGRFRPNDVFIQFVAYISEHRGKSVPDEIQQQLMGAMQDFPQNRFTGAHRDHVDLASMRGTLLDLFIGGSSTTGGDLVRDSSVNEVNKLLKQLIWFHIIDEPHLTNIQTGQRRVLREIFNELEKATLQAAHDWREDKPETRVMRRLPRALRRCLLVALTQASSYETPQKAYRALLDYISGMTESEAYRTHAVLKGHEVSGRLE
ncbi:deoxyguanosinetriphosphate triphosphohydrolase family protein [Microbacterium sp. AGC85]